jgi:hypothetical protein
VLRMAIVSLEVCLFRIITRDQINYQRSSLP